MRLPKLGRRHFLVGAGGFGLALPLLPSLLDPRHSRRASAQTAPPTKRFVAIASQHGGVWVENMFPDRATLDATREIFPGHTMRSGALSLRSEGGDSVLSRVLRAPADRLTPSLAAKMNVIRGIDIPFYIAHHTGGHLGNNGATAGAENLPLTSPTVDQLLAWSPSFYSDADLATTIRERSIHVGSSDAQFSMSWGFSEPGARRGEIVPTPSAPSSRALFDRIFVPGAAPGESRPPVVDRVLESYSRLRNGAFGDATRLSAADRQRLDDHMDRLHELERRLSVRGVTCSDVPIPTDSVDSSDGGLGWYDLSLSSMRRAYQLHNDVIVAAFMCGTSRIATIQSMTIWSESYNGIDFHNLVAHASHETDGVAQSGVVASQRELFQSVFLDLAVKLDVEEADGATYLDNTLLAWTQESGMTTHQSDSIPIITAGGAAGALATGQYLDYRDETNMGLVADYAESEIDLAHRPGLTFTQWLSNVVMAMGADPHEIGGAPLAYGRIPTLGPSEGGGADLAASYPERVLSATTSRLLGLWRA